jgi:hypothetical protein
MRTDKDDQGRLYPSPQLRLASHAGQSHAKQTGQNQAKEGAPGSHTTLWCPNGRVGIGMAMLSALKECINAKRRQAASMLLRCQHHAHVSLCTFARPCTIC